MSKTASILKIISGSEKGKTIELTSDKYSCGRVKENDIVLNDGSVSSKHCVFTACQGGYEVSDAGSTNGTFVNSIEVNSKVLKDDDVVLIGEIELEYTQVKLEEKKENLKLDGSPESVQSKLEDDIESTRVVLKSDKVKSGSKNVESAESSDAVESVYSSSTTKKSAFEFDESSRSLPEMRNFSPFAGKKSKKTEIVENIKKYYWVGIIVLVVLIALWYFLLS